MTPEDVIAMMEAIADGSLAVDMVDWDQFAKKDADNILVGALHILRERQRGVPQRRARELLRSWLSPAQRAELSKSRCVTVIGSAGGRYRLHPETGNTKRVELHGTRWFSKASYCLHPDEWIPPADVALAHYLLLRTDEPAFLAQANEHPNTSSLWDGAYLRRINAARKARAA